MTSPIEQKIDQLLSAYAKQNKLNGAVLVAQKGRVLYQNGFGYRNAEAKIANDANTNTFTIEYSTNNGSSWTLIDNNIAADQRTYIWTTPNIPANTALFRVSRNGSSKPRGHVV